MVLRCPRCSQLKFFGRTQVMGELVVCPSCEAVFRWRDAGTGESDGDGAGPGTRDPSQSDTKRGER